MDNRAAGETAAYLIGEWLGPEPAKVLATLSSNRSRGEEEREIGFRRALRLRYPHLSPTCAESGVGYWQINALDEKSSLHFCRVGVLRRRGAGPHVRRGACAWAERGRGDRGARPGRRRVE